MPAAITMPQQTDTMTEGTVVKWHKNEGDKVKAGEIIVDIETDKATMEVEAMDAGTLAAIVVAAGEKTPVGSPIAWLATGSENPADIKKQKAAGSRSAPAPAAPASAPAAPAKVEVTNLASAGATSGPRGTALTFAGASMGEGHQSSDVGHGATREKPTPVPPLPGGNGNGHGDGGRIFASPLAKRIAADKGIDLSQIRGTGPGGRVVQSDVVNFKPAAPPQASPEKKPAERAELPARVASGENELIPHSKMRTVIARSLQKSKQTIPHFYETIDVDVEELSAIRVRMNELLKSENIKLSISDFVAKAVAVALVKHPALNAHYSDDGITRFGDVNLGIAVAIPDGLIVPVLRNIDQMGLKEIRVRSEAMIQRARAAKQKKEDLGPGTFTISNLGTYGIREFSAIINPPEVAILAVASAEKRPVIRGDAIVARTMLTMTLSADHRAVDGATAAEFLRTLKGLLQEPAMMLA
ncbi:MAG TPA: dihydrolipoamide acetyltransferase family protein [Tepidisphaeraceae bacterium]|jgi:pyruvate dehydrogenase E2 component (dihydrolipoamide acetyltransferase)|nr:dihydrolipoamide acetyltransferase family protein [Tepidisphaeraceae bacterium]